jgi:hypothetical protein
MISGLGMSFSVSVYVWPVYSGFPALARPLYGQLPAGGVCSSTRPAACPVSFP